MADRRATTDPQRTRPGLSGLSSPTMRIAPGIAIAIVLASLLAAGCARPPLGPAFRAAAAPSDLRGRVYLYRADPRGSLATVHVALDDRPVGRFRNDQYETLELAPGTHQLRATLRGFGLTAWGWNTHQFLLEPGQTLYIELSVRLTARAAPDSSNLEIAGRTSGAASENVFIVPRPAKDALPALSSTTRLARREMASD